MLWNVYFYTTTAGVTIPREWPLLGRVRAAHQPGAVKQASKRWPKYRNPHALHLGFAVYPVTDDPIAKIKAER
jgi:hypothetical protein